MNYVFASKAIVIVPGALFRSLIEISGTLSDLSEALRPTPHPKDMFKAPANFPQVDPPFTVQGDFVNSIKTNSAWRHIQSFYLKLPWLKF